VGDIVLRAITFLTPGSGWYGSLSWHGNTNLFVPMGVILPDTRELRAYETLIKLAEDFDQIEKLQKGGYTALAKVGRGVAMVNLGVALHPAQDKHGHIDYYAANALTAQGREAYKDNGSTDGDYVDRPYAIDGVTYNHFDDVYKSRDVTYSTLGRYYMRYEGVIKMK